MYLKSKTYVLLYFRFLLLSILLVKPAEAAAPSFVQQQLYSSRVQEAKSDKNSYLKKIFSEKSLHYPPDNIFLRVFKSEDIMELWAANDGQPYQLVKTYGVCSMAGVLGPKRRQGDFQVPEGFYWIDHFNAHSAYYLSLRINYPNATDRALNSKGNWGGDIYIHGDCMSDGCLAMKDDPIKELYWVCVQAKNNGQGHIPVHIFPTRLSTFKFNILQRIYGGKPQLLDFWANLREGYDFFDRYNRPPKVTAGAKGKYIFS